MVPVALFSNIVPADDKQALADSIIAVKSEGVRVKGTTASLWNIDFRFWEIKIPGNIDHTTKLTDLVGSES